MAELYVDGQWVPARAGGRREIRCPADGALVGEVDEAGAEDTDRRHRRPRTAPSTTEPWSRLPARRAG